MVLSRGARLLKRSYCNLNNPGSFAGVSGFIRNTVPTARRQEAAQALSSLPTYTYFRNSRRRFPRRQTFVPCLGNQFQADLIDVRKYKHHNSGVSYILTCIDVFSRYAYMVPIKNKRAPTVISAFKLVFKTAKRFPTYVQTDMGREFLAKSCQEYFQKNAIRHFYTGSPMKCAVLERLHRTLKERLSRWMHFTGSKSYLKALEKILRNYNRSYHRSIKMCPSEVNKQNEVDVFINLYGDQNKPRSSTKPRFQINDRVLLAREKDIFEKGASSSWYNEVFTVDVVQETDPVTYLLKDSRGRCVHGAVYDQEIQKITHQ